VGPRNDDDHPPDCGIREVLDQIGDKWSLLLVAKLAKGSASSVPRQSNRRSAHGPVSLS
jgi:DNA-binding HxlR family transcriptional regulator